MNLEGSNQFRLGNHSRSYREVPTEDQNAVRI